VIGIRQPARLYRLARQLQLGWISTVKLFGVYYFGRRAVLRKLFPDSVVLDVPGWGRIPLRANGCDYLLLIQMFVRQDYRLEASGVRRILDLGANIGMATVYLSRLFPQAEIACVEPSPQNTPLLKRAIALNGIRARVFEAAAGAESGSVDLYIAARPDCNSIYPVECPSSVVAVPLIPVPEIMERMGWDRIDVLKIDIEGAEKELLGRNNSWLRNVRVITGESHVNAGYSYAQLKADLNGYGFVLETLIPETADYGASFRGARSIE
jgi:FkbM family methyltransferase